MFFLNARCSNDANTLVGASATVTLGSGTSDVKHCLMLRHEKNLWAVGVFSTENVADSESTPWRFIKMDGVAPTLLNTFNGRWQFFVEQTFQWRGDRSEAPLTGWKLLLIEHFAAQAGNPLIVAKLNEKFRHTWGDAGVLALGTSGIRPPIPVPGQPVNTANLRENPVLALTHATRGATNNCVPPVAIHPTVAP